VRGCSARRSPSGGGPALADSELETFALGEAQRVRLLYRLAPRLTDGVVSIVSSEHRSQLQNRTAARARLTDLLDQFGADIQPFAMHRMFFQPFRAQRVGTCLRRHAG